MRALGGAQPIHAGVWVQVRACTHTCAGVGTGGRVAGRGLSCASQLVPPASKMRAWYCSGRGLGDASVACRATHMCCDAELDGRVLKVGVPACLQGCTKTLEASDRNACDVELLSIG